MCLVGWLGWLVWFGLVWFGLVWSGLVWSGLVCLFASPFFMHGLSWLSFLFVCLLVFVCFMPGHPAPLGPENTDRAASPTKYKNAKTCTVVDTLTYDSTSCAFCFVFLFGFRLL